jgi:predicted transcriptional regulator YheO
MTPLQWIASVFAELAASLVLLGAGYLIGLYRERLKQQGRALTEYDFYPYVATPEKFAEFSLKDFRLGMHHFLRNVDRRAARQLIFIGDQNNVRNVLSDADARSYTRLCSKYHTRSIADDTQQFLDNYRNIVRLLGRTFRNLGIEILLHDLSDPSHSVTTIENGEITGRVVGMGTTTLLVDLMRRVNLKQDKLNYAVQMGARHFKCTTIPIVRQDFGVVGAICMNVDVNYIKEQVMPSPERSAEFFENLCSTDMTLEENFLSKDEYKKALEGKRHLRDFAEHAQHA